MTILQANFAGVGLFCYKEKVCFVYVCVFKKAVNINNLRDFQKPEKQSDFLFLALSPFPFCTRYRAPLRQFSRRCFCPFLLITGCYSWQCIILPLWRSPVRPWGSIGLLRGTKRWCGCNSDLSTLLLQIDSWRQEPFVLSLATVGTQLNFLDKLSVSVELEFDLNFPWVTNNTALSQSSLLAR